MRDLVVVSIVVVGALMALRRPWIGVMLWTWLSIMSPHRYTWGFAYDAPLAAIAAGVTLLGLLMTRQRQSPFQGSPITIFAVFSVWVTLSWLSGVDTTADYAQWDKVMKIFLMTFVSVAALQNRYHILAFASVTAGSLAILGAKGGLFTILHGGDYRVWGPPGSFIEDNNEFALALIMTVPLLAFLKMQAEARWLRSGLTLVMFLCAAAALGSHSRGALLALAAMGAMFWLRNRQKGSATLLIAVVLLVLLPMMPEEWWSRMESIGDYQNDSSAQGRLYAWQVATNLAIHRPFGAGMSFQNPLIFALYGDGEGTVIAAHSIYFQILGNHGFIGLALFIGIWIATFRYAGWLRTHAVADPAGKWAADLGAMIQVSLVGYLVGGAFLSLAYFDLAYDMMVMVVLARKWVETEGWRREPPMSFLEYAGLRKPPIARTAAGVTNTDSGAPRDVW